MNSDLNSAFEFCKHVGFLLNRPFSLDSDVTKSGARRNGFLLSAGRRCCLLSPPVERRGVRSDLFFNLIAKLTAAVEQLLASRPLREAGIRPRGQNRVRPGFCSGAQGWGEGKSRFPGPRRRSRPRTWCCCPPGGTMQPHGQRGTPPPVLCVSGTPKIPGHGCSLATRRRTWFVSAEMCSANGLEDSVKV